MVSIIIPTYNREKEIGRAVWSILQQTYVWYEIIIVDDGSTDNTEEVIRQFADDRIRYIQLETNQGPSHARNIGIKEALYDYIAFHDSDDEWMPDKLELQMCKMTQVSEMFGLVYCRMSGIARDGSSRFVCPPLEYERSALEGSMFKILLRQNAIGTPTMLVRKECLEKVGGFKEGLNCLEDWELILRIARNYQIGFVDEILLEVHKLPDSVSVNIGAYIVSRCYMMSKYRKEMLEYGIFESISREILVMAEAVGLLEETRELLNKDFEI